MKLKPGCAAEYKRRHDEIWPELLDAFKKAGVMEYHIFLDERTGTLFAFQTVEENDGLRKLRGADLMKRWWRHMAEVLEVDAEGIPASRALTQMFGLEEQR